MKTLFVLLVVTLLVVAPSRSQSPVFASLENARRALEAGSLGADTQTQASAQRRAAAVEAHQFELRLADFARVWNDFVQEYNDKRTYNVKKAKALARALKKLESELPR